MQNPGKRWRQKGFTLIEGLIASVIVAILAAVAIPMYLGYVEAQRRSTVESLAQSAAVSANAMYRRGGMVGLNQAQIEAAIKSTLFLPNPTAYRLSVPNGSAGQVVIVQDSVYTSIADTVNYR